MVFMGEEWAASTPWQFFTDFDEPELARAVRTGRREEFAEHGWSADEIPDPQAAGTRAASILDWAEVEVGDHGRLLGWYRSLIELRRREPDLQADDLSDLHAEYDEDARWFALTRGEHRVVVNLSDRSAEVPLGDGPWRVVLAWGAVAASPSSLLMPTESAAVVVRG
jgi:maltooligosyltrehalose trehalohydrolase